MGVPVVYCEEKGENVNIFEARDYYFAQPEETRQRLNFLCADEACRNATKPMMIGVNYDKLPGEYVLNPHFKAHTDYHHAPECPWVEYKILEEELENSGISPRLTNLKQTEVVGLFNPVEGKDQNEINEPPVDWAEIRQIRKIINVREKMEAFKAFITRSVNKTSYLQDVCTCFEMLTPEERKQVPLKIGELKERTYSGYFAGVQFCRPDAWFPRIYHGKANVREWLSGYSIRFEMRSKTTDGNDCTVTIFVKKDMLENFRGKNQLRQVLNVAVKKKKSSVYCYAFGKIVRIEDKDSNLSKKIDISINSLHSLVVKLAEEC